MSWTFDGRIIAPPSRQITLNGVTIVDLLPSDVVLEISSALGTTPFLRQLYAEPLLEGRVVFLWNNSGVAVGLGRLSLDPDQTGPENAYDIYPSGTANFPAGDVCMLRYHTDGGLPGSNWPLWQRVPNTGGL